MILCFIPARKGSKRLKEKNKTELLGKPLIAYTIESAKKSGLFNKIVVSSDDNEIIEIAKKQGVDFHTRPEKFGADNVTVAEVIEDYIKTENINKEYKEIVVLYPTSPLRESQDIINSWKMYENKGGNGFLVSVTEFDFPPQLAMKLDANSGELIENKEGSYEKNSQSQQHTKLCRPNGSIFIFNINKFIEQESKTFYGKPLFGYLMPFNRSVDIDYPHQLKFAELLLKEKTEKLKDVKIGNIPIGDNNPVAFMAELGTFYNKDVNKAMEFIDKAVAAGAHIIKTEILHDPNICLKKANLTTTYNHTKGKTKENYRELIERKTVPLSDYKKIIEYCKNKGVPIVASVYDFEGIDFFVENGGSAIKLWRNNYNNFPLIKHAAKTGLPIIFDFVDNTVEEMDKAIKTAINNGASGVIINYHPGKNPAKPEEHNLRLIKTYKKYFGVPIGISCHYKGDEILYASVGMGVNIIEKGVFDNPDKNEQNVISAAALDDLKNMINKVNNCSKALGNSKINIKDSELRDQTLQYGLVAKTDINEGESLTQNNVRFAFPCVGISVEDWESIEGRPAKRNIKEDNEITLEDI